MRPGKQYGMEDSRLRSLTDLCEDGVQLCKIFRFLSLRFLIRKMCVIVPPRALVRLDNLYRVPSVLEHSGFSMNVGVIIGNRISIYTQRSLTVEKCMMRLSLYSFSLYPLMKEICLFTR